MKIKKVNIDIDGVMRDLNLMVLGGDPDVWDPVFNEKDHFNVTVNKNLDLLYNAPQTIYFPIICEFIKRFEKISVITCQQIKWVPNTLKWLDDNFKKYDINKYDVKIVSHIIDKENYIGNNELLIEDYPFFSKKMSKKVVLIDRPYNQNAQNYLIRIKNPNELRSFLENV